MELHFVIENERLYDELPGMFEFHGQRADAIEAGAAFSVRPGDLYLLDGAALSSWSKLTMGGTSLDNLNRVLICGNKSVQLSDREYSLMRLLMLRRDMCVAKNIIFHYIWGHDSEATENNVEAYIRLLRKKLKGIDSDLQIETIRWHGYRLSKLMNP